MAASNLNLTTSSTLKSSSRTSAAGATEFYAAAWTDTKVGRKRDEARNLTQTWLDFNHLPSSPVLT